MKKNSVFLNAILIAIFSILMSACSNERPRPDTGSLSPLPDVGTTTGTRPNTDSNTKPNIPGLSNSRIPDPNTGAGSSLRKVIKEKPNVGDKAEKPNIGDRSQMLDSGGKNFPVKKNTENAIPSLTPGKPDAGNSTRTLGLPDAGQKSGGTSDIKLPKQDSDDKDLPNDGKDLKFPDDGKDLRDQKPNSTNSPERPNAMYNSEKPNATGVSKPPLNSTNQKPPNTTSDEDLRRRNSGPTSTGGSNIDNSFSQTTIPSFNLAFSIEPLQNLFIPVLMLVCIFCVVGVLLIVKLVRDLK